MTESNPSIMSHVSIGTNQTDKALAFYDKVLATIGARRMLLFREPARDQGQCLPLHSEHASWRGRIRPAGLPVFRPIAAPHQEPERDTL